MEFLSTKYLPYVIGVLGILFLLTVISEFIIRKSLEFLEQAAKQKRATLSPRVPLLLWALPLMAYAALLYAFKGKDYIYVSFAYHIVLAILALLALPQVLSHVTSRHILTIMRKTLTNRAVIAVTCIMVLSILVNHFFATLAVASLPTTVLKISFSGLLYILIVIAIAPSTEELFFRGYLQMRLQKALFGPFGGLVIASILYGLAHIPKAIWAQQYDVAFSLIPHLSSIRLWITPISAGALGYLFGYIYLETRSLVYPIVLHVGWNTAILVIRLLQY